MQAVYQPASYYYNMYVEASITVCLSELVKFFPELHFGKQKIRKVSPEEANLKNWQKKLPNRKVIATDA
jgi:hypothetical protein